MKHLAKALTDVFVYNGIYSKYRRKVHGKPVQHTTMHRFVGFIQNHDQVGNRATGDRLEHIVGIERAKAALGLVLTSPFIPMLFQGEEFATSSPFQYFAHHEEEEMARAVSEGRKREFAAFGWSPESIPDPESRETFLRSKLAWDERTEGAHAEMLDWCRRLIAFRHKNPSLTDGELGQTQVEFSEELRWLVMDRGSVRVILNLGNNSLKLPLDGYKLQLASGTGVEPEGETILVPPSRLAILSAN
jgi:maltooligosyltrehalose trehalohydrolase